MHRVLPNLFFRKPSTSMKLYLIRHGETVDNVAGLYAGSRDSPLTNHGFEQAKRLGASFAENEVNFTHIFASPLSRAYRTACAIRDAQSDILSSGEGRSLEVVKVPEIVERDYGPYEGRPYSTKSEWKRTGKDGLEEARGGVESAPSMAKRGDKFLDEHLMPLFEEARTEAYVVAIVAHGMLLSHLWRRLLLRLPRKNLTMTPEVQAARPDVVLETLSGWSNTGFLELLITRDEEQEPAQSGVGVGGDFAASKETATLPTPIPPPLQAEGAGVSIAPPQPAEVTEMRKTNPKVLTGHSTTILAIDSRKHLLGLKRQPGGIGSLANEQGQKKVDAFFKRQKLT